MAIYRGDTKVSGVGKGFRPENAGTEGQVLTKTATGYAYQDIEALPDGGTVGQVLTKTQSGADWEDAQGGLPEGGTEGQILMMVNGTPTWVTPTAKGFKMIASDSPLTVPYDWYGTEAQYTAATKSEDTEYRTV